MCDFDISNIEYHFEFFAHFRLAGAFAAAIRLCRRECQRIARVSLKAKHRRTAV
jgi:hypothetical protein